MKKHQGFTITELVVVLGIISSLFVFTVISIASSQTRPSLTAAGNLLITDLNRQRISAMSGQDNLPQGIFFEAHRYTLFSGDLSDPNKIIVDIPSPITIDAANLVNDQIIFSQVTGQTNLAIGQDYLLLTDPITSTTVTVLINPYGVAFLQ